MMDALKTLDTFVSLPVYFSLILHIYINYDTINKTIFVVIVSTEMVTVQPGYFNTDGLL